MNFLSLFPSTPTGVWRGLGGVAFLFMLAHSVCAQDCQPIDMASPDSVKCVFTNTEDVAVQVENVGTGAVNFSSNNLALTVNVSGVVTASFTDTIRTGSLAGAAVGTYRIATGALDLEAPGAYQFEVIARLNSDVNRSNDTLQRFIYYNGISIQRPYRFGFEQTPATPFDSVDLDHYLEVQDVNNDFTQWLLIQGGQRSGTLSYSYNYNGTNNTDDWVFLRCLPLDSGNFYELDFYHSLTFGPGSQNLEVWIGPSQQASGMRDSLLQVSRPAANTIDYQQASASYFCDSSGIYYIGFHAENPNAYNGGTANQYWLIDDISVRKLAAVDVGITKILEPARGACTGGSENLRVRLRNFGRNTVDFSQDSVEINVRVLRNDTLLPQAFRLAITQDSLVGNASLDTVITTGLDMRIPGTYSLEVSTVLNGDQVEGNDTATAVRYKNGVFPYRPYTMGFESDDPFEAYERNFAIQTENRNQDNTAWGFFSANEGRTGTYPANLDLESGGDDWLFLGCFDGLGQKTYEVVLWARHNAATDPVLEVYSAGANTAASALSASGQRLDSVAVPGGNTYTPIRFRFTLQNASGPQYLGFRGLSSAAGGTLYIDDLKISSVSPLDARVLGFTQPTANACLSGQQPVLVDIFNAGLDTLDELTLEVKVNDTLTSASGQFTGLGLAPGDTTTLDAGLVNFVAGRSFDFEARISRPNQQTDSDTSDNLLVVNNLTADTQRIRLPFNENFDASAIAVTAFGDLYTDQESSQLEWETQNGNTPSGGTGPTSDFSGNGNYIFMETSGSNAGDSAVLLSNCIPLSEFSAGELNFKYHMAGDGIGYLRVNALLPGARVVRLLELNGPQQTQPTDGWLDTSLSLRQFRGQTIRLQWVGRVDPLANVTFLSDIALDEVRLRDGCASVTGSGPRQAFVSPDTIYTGSPAIFANQFQNTSLEVYKWIRGDSLVSRAFSPRLRFPQAGQDSLTLISATCYGADTTTDTFTVYPQNRKPRADFLTRRSEIGQGDSIQLLDLTEFGGVQYRYTVTPSKGVVFTQPAGDTTASPNIRFDSAGTFTIRLVVSNPLGTDTVVKTDLIEVLPVYLFCPNLELTTLKGIIYDDGGPQQDYANDRSGNAACETNIDPCAGRVVLYFEDFALEQGDFLEVYDGDKVSGTPLFSTVNYPNGFTGNINAANFPDSIVATSGQVFMRFSTDAADNNRGFEIRYRGDSAQLTPAAADFEGPDTVCLGQPFTLRSTSNGDRLDYRWYLGHGLNNPNNLPLQAFLVSGDVNPELTVTNSDVSPEPTPGTPSLVDIQLGVQNCQSSDLITRNLTVEALSVPDPGVMKLRANKRKVGLDEDVVFEPVAEGCVARYEWSVSPSTVAFRQGTNAQSPQPVIAFQDTGKYDITLMVITGTDSQTVTKTQYIEVLDYCEPLVNTGNDDISITGVRFSNLDRSSGPANYTDFTNGAITEVEVGRPYALEVRRNTRSNLISYALWADLNRDGDFTDPGELLTDTVNLGGTLWKDTLRIPATTVPGYTRLRIGASLGNQSNTACGPNLVGEFEDYGIRVAGDRSAPQITFQKGDTLFVEAGFPYNDPGFSAFDFVDGDLTSEVQVNGRVDTSRVDTYQVSYQVSDSANNVAQRTRVVIVTPDVTPPRLQLEGSNPLALLVFDPYVEPGFTAFDRLDGALADSVVIKGQVDTTLLGTYRLTYEVQDIAGNDTSAIREVNVIDTLAPVLTLLGDRPLELGINESFDDPGYLLRDNYYDSIEVSVQVSGQVDTGQPGSYPLVYSAEDPSGNTAFVQREVIVDTALGLSAELPASPGLQVYPNPADQWLSILVPKTLKVSQLRIYAISGKMVWSGAHSKGSKVKAGQLRINSLGWEEGMYMISAEEKDKPQYSTFFSISH